MAGNPHDDTRDLVFVFAAGEHDAVEHWGTSYMLKACIPFEGTDKLGIPTAIKAIVNTDGNSQSCNMKIYDMTNDLTIVEKTGLNNEDLEYIDLGTLDNLPEDEAILELHLKASSGDGILVYSLVIKFD